VCGLSITVSGLVLSSSSHPEDCRLRVWNLKTQAAVISVLLSEGRPESPTCLHMRDHGALVAVALDDGALQVVDLHGNAIVRSFVCSAPVVDLAFTPEGRWLAAALRGGGLRIFDLPAGRCIDSCNFGRPALSLCFSPTSAFLLTSHAGNNIQVWANKFLFDPSVTAPLLRPEPKLPINLDEPGAGVEEEDDDENAESGRTQAVTEGKLESSTTPLHPQILTLSDVPPAKWQATLHLDLVKERNKPAEPAKPLPNAPFFLPTSTGITPQFVSPELATDPVAFFMDDSTSKVVHGRKALGASMPLQVMLRKAEYDAALEFLRAQTSSGVHLAIEELGPMAGGGTEELEAGLLFFEHHLRMAHFADELQAFLLIFLQTHGEEICQDADLTERCGRLADVQDELWCKLDASCQKVRCFLGTLTHTQSQW